MKHLTDEEMIEHIYGESESTAAVERHLERCRECAAGFAELKRDLAEVDRMEAPARDAGYGERVWAAIAPLLPVYALGRLDKRRWWSLAFNNGLQSGLVRGLSYVAAAALLVACGFYAGRMWTPTQPTVADRHDPSAPAQPKQPIVVVVLDDHLDRSERFLVELKHADMDSTAMASPMRDEAKSLLAANRVCRKNAAQSDDKELTTALDHLDSLLADVANEPGGLNAENIAKLQEEMNRDGVLFEVRVLRSRMAHHDRSGNDSPKGGTI
jgi:hypothetical protein